jgi:hypothetical protein
VEWERNHNKKCEEVKGFLMGSTMGNDWDDITGDVCVVQVWKQMIQWVKGKFEIFLCLYL